MIKWVLFIILSILPATSSPSENNSPSTLLALSHKIQNKTLYLKVSFSTLPEYELHQFPSRCQAVVKFINANLPQDWKIPEIKEAILKDIQFIQDNGILRMVLSFSQKVRIKIYPLSSTNEIVIELEQERRGPRVEHTSFVLYQGPDRVRVNLISLDLDDPNLFITPALARDRIPGLERISSLVKRLGALAGINGGYFAPNGDPLGLLIIDGEMLSEPIFNRTAIGYTKNREVVITNVDFNAQIRFKLNGRILRLDGINRKAGSKETILYTPHYGTNTGRINAGVELSIVNGKIVEIYSKDATIPKGGYVLSLPEPYTPLDFSPWDEIEVIYGLPLEFEGVIWAIGAGPRLVKEGKVDLTGREERFRSDILHSCTARSAIGVTFDNRLLLITVDQGNGSRGMWLKELAELMVSLGVRDGMNLDGGSSSTLVYRNQVVNTPSNGYERPVASALLVFDRTPLSNHVKTGD